jgi:hypothetical protein
MDTDMEIDVAPTDEQKGLKRPAAVDDDAGTEDQRFKEELCMNKRSTHVECPIAQYGDCATPSFVYLVLVFRVSSAPSSPRDRLLRLHHLPRDRLLPPLLSSSATPSLRHRLPHRHPQASMSSAAIASNPNALTRRWLPPPVEPPAGDTTASHHLPSRHAPLPGHAPPPHPTTLTS